MSDQHTDAIKPLADVQNTDKNINILCSNCGGFICATQPPVDSFEGYCGRCDSYTFLSDAIVEVGEATASLTDIQAALWNAVEAREGVHASALEECMRTRDWYDHD